MFKNLEVNKDLLVTILLAIFFFEVAKAFATTTTIEDGKVKTRITLFSKKADPKPVAEDPVITEEE